MQYYSKKRKGNKNKAKKIILFLIAIVIITSLFEGIYLYIHKDKIFPGVSALGVQWGGLNRREVQEILPPIMEKVTNSPRILVFEDQRMEFIPQEDLDASFDLSQAVEELYRIGRSGNIFKRIKDRIILGREGYEVTLLPQLNPEKLKDLQNKINSLVSRVPSDAYLDLDNNRVVESKVGIELDLEELNREILKTLSCAEEDKYVINIPTIIIPPQYTTQDLLDKRGISQELGVYSTSLENKEENTLHNIKLASQEINGRIVKPQEIFSFNKYVGPAEKEDGYKEGIIIANGKFESGYGGGVCQVSSTLYNAALLANLAVVERYNHSIYGEATKYVPLGRDAAVFFGYKDLKFRNNLDHEIVIFAKVEGEVLQVNILGSSLDKSEEVEIISKDEKMINYPVIREKDPKLKPNQQVVVQEGIPGYEVKTYRLVREDGQEKVELLSNDTYNSVPMIIKEN